MSSLVYFDGAWSTSDTELVKEAVAEAEQANLPDVSSMPNGRTPWVSTYHLAGIPALYIASRLGVSRIFVAKSAAALADKIRRFAETV